MGVFGSSNPTDFIPCQGPGAIRTIFERFTGLGKRQALGAEPDLACRRRASIGMKGHLAVLFAIKRSQPTTRDAVSPLLRAIVGIAELTRAALQRFISRSRNAVRGDQETDG